MSSDFTLTTEDGRLIRGWSAVINVGDNPPMKSARESARVMEQCIDFMDARNERQEVFEFVRSVDNFCRRDDLIPPWHGDLTLEDGQPVEHRTKGFKGVLLDHRDEVSFVEFAVQVHGRTVHYYTKSGVMRAWRDWPVRVHDHDLPEMKEHPTLGWTYA